MENQSHLDHVRQVLICLLFFYLLFGLIMRNFKTKYVSLALHSLFLPRSLPPPMLLPNLITYKKEPCFVFRF